MFQRLMWIILCGLLAGCVAEMEVATAVPTRVVVATETAVPPTSTAIVVTETAVLPTATAVPTNTLPASLPTDTPTVSSPTPTSTPEATETPTNTPIPLPPPPGEIYFFLDPDPPPDTESLEQKPPRTYDLYRAIPGTTANEWQLETIWTETFLARSTIMVSPDETKLALLLLEDTNGDDQLNDDPGMDVRNIYIYDRSANSIEQLTNNQYNSFSVSWLPDSQAVTYPQSTNVFTTYLDDPTPRTVLQLPDGHFEQLSWSLDGQQLVLHVVAQPAAAIRVYEPDLNSLYTAYEAPTGNVWLKWWSPDGRWLAFTHHGHRYYGNWRYIAVMNNESLEVTRLVFGEDYMSAPPDWSVDSQWLAFTKNESSLSLWNADTLTVTDVLSKTNMSIPAWSPLENRVAVAYVEDELAKVVTLDPQTNIVTEVFQSEAYDVLKLFDWSPDGEWLLIFAANDEQSGLYVLHVASGASYLVMDTAGGESPEELVWLPTP